MTGLEHEIKTMRTYWEELVHFIENGEEDDAYEDPLQLEMLVVCTILEAAHDDSPIRTNVFVHIQTANIDCKDFSKTFGQSNSDFMYDRYGFLIRRSKIDWSLEKVVPKQLRSRV